MSIRAGLARAGWLTAGAGLMSGLIVLTLAGTADAANCCRTAVAALKLSRMATPALDEHPSSLAFTGAQGIVVTLAVGVALLVLGGLFVSMARRRTLRASHLFIVIAGLAAACVAFVGVRGADAAVPAASSSCCPAQTGTTTGTTGTTPGTTVSGTTMTAPPAGTTNPGSPSDPGSPADPGSPSDPGTGTPPPTLPDSGVPVSLVLCAGFLGAGTLYMRRRRTT